MPTGAFVVSEGRSMFNLTASALRKRWPNTKQSVVDGIVAAWPEVAAHYGFTTKLRCAHFWAQGSWECGGGTELRESGHYSADAIMRTFGIGVHSAKVTRSEAEKLAKLAKTDGGRALLNRVYGLGNPKKAAELGNTEPNDGWDFRGFGVLNSTGREAAKTLGDAIGKDLVDNPDLCNDPGIALWVGAEEYVNSLHCFKFADADDTYHETKRINGGTNGLKEREAAVALWKRVVDANWSDGSEDVPVEPKHDLAGYELKAVQSGLKELGYYTGRPDGLPGRLTTQAIAGFRHDHGMEPGEWDEACREALDLAIKSHATASVSDSRAEATKADVEANPVVAKASSDKSTAVITGAAGVVGIVKSAAGDGDPIDQAQHVADKASQAWGLLSPVIDWASAHPGAIGGAVVIGIAGWWWMRSHGIEQEVVALFRQGKAEG